MNLIRDDQQLGLNDLLVAIQKSSDHYRDAASYLESSYPSSELWQIARERDQIASQLRRAIRELGDLPSAPDEDRESVEKLFHRVHASLSENEIQDLLDQRLDAEREFMANLERIRREEWAQEKSLLLSELGEHTRATITRLEELTRQCRS